jgi:hypothetical protein
MNARPDDLPPQDGPADPAASTWVPPEPLDAAPRSAWIPPGTPPQAYGTPPMPPPVPPPMPPYGPHPPAPPYGGPPAYGPPARRRMPRWAKIVIVVAVAGYAISLLIQVLNLVYLGR